MLRCGELLQGRYRVIEPLGAGSSGVVYLLEDLRCRSGCLALKELAPESLPPEEVQQFLDMFQRETDFLKSLHHKGLPRFMDSFSHGGSYYIVMEHIEGETLDVLMQRNGRPFTPREVTPWALQIAEILDYLHTRLPFPVIFRDLKPSNIMLTPGGEIKLIDFGIARYFSANKVKDTYCMGTPGFSAPEQYGSGQSDARTDIFSFGATLYFLLTNTDMTAFNFRYPGLSSCCPGIPPRFEEMILRCLSVNPGERCQSAREILDILESIIHAPAPSKGAHSIPAGIGPGWYVATAMVVILSGLFFSILYDKPFICLVSLFVFLPFSLLIMYCIDRLSRRYSLVIIFIEIMLFICAFTVIAACIVPNFLRARSSGQMSACKSNLKNLGISMDMYSTDNFGKYPLRLEQITPNYLKVLPTCASAGEATYTYERAEKPDVYTIYCKGDYHRRDRCKTNYPQYDSIHGLIEK